jgi:hypothetical protein
MRTTYTFLYSHGGKDAARNRTQTILSRKIQLLIVAVAIEVLK